MWGFLSEWLSDFLPFPWRVPAHRSVAKSLIGLVVCAAVVGGLGFLQPALALIPLCFSAFAMFQVGFAFRCLERAAVLDLDDPMEPPREPHRFLPYAIPTAIALHELALFVDAVRRGKMLSAFVIESRVDTTRLRASEVRLFEAASALLTLSSGDRGRATQRALAALPSGCEDFDLLLGRLALASAWENPVRLWKMDDAWALAGITLEGDSNLSTLRCLLELRLSEREPDLSVFSETERLSIAKEARLLGDEKLARELEKASLPGGSYRD